MIDPDQIPTQIEDLKPCTRPGCPFQAKAEAGGLCTFHAPKKRLNASPQQPKPTGSH